MAPLPEPAYFAKAIIALAPGVTGQNKTKRQSPNKSGVHFLSSYTLVPLNHIM